MANSKNEDWKELWLKNYRGEGDTEELQDFVKELNYGSRKHVSYLPWATVERIYKFQGGEYEVLKNNENPSSIVHRDVCKTKDIIDPETGEIEASQYVITYFLKLWVKWQEQEYIETYPLQSNTSHPLTQWTQNDLNKNVQRAKVKAIANVSGIGYKLFEDGDLQFSDSEDEEIEEKQRKKTKVTNTKKPKEKPSKTEEKPLTSSKDEADEEENSAAVEDTENAEEAKEVEGKNTTEAATTPSNMPEKRIDIENEIKQIFLKGHTEKNATIRSFLEENLDEKESKKVSKLSREKLEELYELVAEE